MSFPVAVAPSVRSPGLALRVDLLAAAASPGQGALITCLLASKGTAGTGTITADTELVEAVAGPDDVATYLVAGTPGHLASKAWFAENPLGRLDLVAPADPAGTAASGTFTIPSQTVTATRTHTFLVAGRPIEVLWLPGETNEQFATKVGAAINALSADLPVTASVTTNVVTLTFKVTGTLGNDCTISVTATGGAPAAALAAASAATLASGAGTCSVVNALTLISGQEYAFILNASNGNTDSGAASATSSVGRIKTHVEGLDEGFSAKLQQIVQGLTGSLSNAKTGAAQHNFGPLQYILMANGLSLPCEVGAAEAGARAREESIDPAVNRINMVYKATLYPPSSLVSGALTEAQVEDGLQSGVTPVTYTSTGTPRPSRPITTYWKDTASNADGRLLDTSRISGTYAVARDLRSALPAEFPNAKLSRDLVPGDEPPPAGVVEERDVKAFVTTRMRFWVSQGVVQRASFNNALANGQFLVRVNPSDPAQCDIVLPFGIVPPLAKFSLVVQHVGPS